MTRVHDTIWCCRSGSAADTQAVADIVQYQLGLFSMMNGKPPTTQTAASIFQEVCYSNKDSLSYVAPISNPQKGKPTGNQNIKLDGLLGKARNRFR